MDEELKLKRKLNVLDEIGIPSKSEIIHDINMSEEEKFCYSEAQTLHLTEFKSEIKRFNISPTSSLDLDSYDMLRVLKPFMDLHKIFSSPIAIHDDIMSKKCVPSLEQLTHLKEKYKNICKVELDRICNCYNALAVIDIMKDRFNDAVKKYQSVLDLIQTYNRSSIYVNTFIHINSLYNLNKLTNMMQLENKNENSTYYKNECVRLEWEYLEPHYNRLKKEQKNCDIIRKKVQNIERKLIKNNWFVTILNDINGRGLNQQLINNINLDNRTFKISFDADYKIFDGIKTIHDIYYVLNTWTNEIFSYRKKFLKEFGSINRFVNNIKPDNGLTKYIRKRMINFIKCVHECHISEVCDVEKLCNLCEAKNYLSIYEQTFTCENDDSTMQKILLKLLSFAKCHSISLNYVKHGEQFFKFIEAIKKEHKEYENFLDGVEYIVKAYVDLNMSSTHFKQDYLLRSQEISLIYRRNNSHLSLFKEKFSKHIARFKFFSHLQDENDPGDCPVCTLHIATKYSLFECGHHFCMSCLSRMIQNHKETNISSLKCAVCREEQFLKDIYIVSNETEDCEIVGNFSSKIDKIIRVIINLKNTDENIKILVFSQYETNLELISKGLQYNNIKYLMNESAEHIDDFKNKQKGITCLLMIFDQSFNGLDLTEATQVVLVEPTLNPDKELQAINRIYRIGHSKPTVVHRFIIKDSMENVIHSTLVDYVKHNRQKYHINLDYILKLFKN